MSRQATIPKGQLAKKQKNTKMATYTSDVDLPKRKILLLKTNYHRALTILFAIVIGLSGVQFRE